MTLAAGIIEFLIMIFYLLFMYFMFYSINIKTAKHIFGVTNRKEFASEEAAAEIKEIVSNKKKTMKYIIAILVLAGIALLLFDGIKIKTTLWVSLVFIAIFAGGIPYFLGNKEMKSLKYRLGIQKEGVVYTDLKNAGIIRGLCRIKVLIPNIISFIMVIVIILIDIDVIKVEDKKYGDSALGIIVLGSMFLVGILITVFAFAMDARKNEVISSDSDINANYNRAKKRNVALLSITILWLNTAYMLLSMIILLKLYSDLFVMSYSIVFFVMIIAVIIIYFNRDRKIEARYRTETTIVTDDDDNWIGGMFYYNKKDRRLMVPKRFGVGGTMNIAHPAGKVLCAFVVGVLLFTLGTLVWMGMLETTPLKLKLEDNKVICHQIWDDYVIPVEDIQECELLDDLKDHKFVRVSGIGMENQLGGNFTVDGESGCKVFLDTRNTTFIKIRTKDTTYYINAHTREETRTVYESIIS